MQQTIVNQVPGTEQPQEEVQLTELLPVKQSRIRETSIFKDADGTTDALKVLRSFTGDCNEEQGFELQAFNFPGRIDRQPGNKRAYQRKRNRCRTAAENSGNDGKEETDDSRMLDSESRRRGVRGIGKRTGARLRGFKSNGKIAKTQKKRREMQEEIGEEEEAEERSADEAMDEKNNLTDQEELMSEYDDEESSVILDLDKSKDFNDEVYVFRRETVDSHSSSDAQEDPLRNGQSVGDSYESGYRAANGQLFDVNAPFVEGNDVQPAEAGKEDNTDGSSEKLIRENTEKELSLNINAIIQANYLLERENNNIVSEESKVQDVPSASPSLSPSAEGFGYSSNDGASSRKSEETNGGESQEKKYCCVVCDAKFKGSGGLRNHYKIVHGAGPIFKCDECGKEFPLKERLKLHVRTHTGFKPYKCPECDKSFARGGQLVQHRRTHSQVKPYRCALCSGTFTCAANLALHVKRHNGQKDHKCEICGRAFVRRDALKKHLECLHRDVKSFLCVICNKTFKGHLPQHMRTHARDRPHGCATCGQRFAQKSQLTVHQRTHSGQRPFRCLVCWQAFAHSTALKLHTRRHTGERPFKCAECNAGFTQLPHWKKHMKCIHGRNEPYGCKRCKSFFRIKNDLESHEKTCHPEAESNVESATNSDSMGSEAAEKTSPPSRYRVMTVERMRLLLAVLLKRISRQERLDELGFGKRLIDEVLQDSLISAGKDPATGEGLSELETLTKNLEIFLEWTVPKEHWENFRKLKKTPEDILETLTAT